MRILHVITSLYTGGAEKLMVDLLPRLRDAGNEVDLMIFDGTRTPFRRELEKEGIRILDCGEGNSVYNPKNILALRKIIRNYDIIHTHNTSPQFFAALAALGKNVKLVTTEHNTNNRRRNMLGFSRIDKWMYGHYDSIICISGKAEENLREFLKSDSKKICTIFNGVDISKFEKAEASEDLRQNLPEHAKVITMVAAFRPQKNQDCLIRAMDQLPNEYHLFLIGDGERRKECETLAQSLKSKDRIHFLGRRSDIPQLLKASDYIVLSSHYEGLSLSSIEGMSVGKPFIASDVDGLHEIVYGSGVLFPDNDAETLANEILKLENNPEQYKKISDACGRRAKQFDISKMTNNYLEIYNKLSK